jgi:predicted RNA methylase
MPVMKQKLVEDFLETDRISKLITTGQLDVEMGVEVLGNMIEYVRNDIKTLDQEAYIKLDAVIKELGAVNKNRKEQIRAKVKEPDDVLDERNLKRKLLLEDFYKFKQEILAIQNLAFNRGWFD